MDDCAADDANENIIEMKNINEKYLMSESSLTSKANFMNNL